MKIEFWPLIEEVKQFPPESAKKCFPTWYKICPASPEGTKEKPSAKEMAYTPEIQCSTIKRCPPVQDFLMSGYVIKNFIDIQITQETSLDGIEKVFLYHNKRIGKPYISTHNRNQFPGLGKKKEVLKLTGVWSIRTPPGYSSLFFPLFYHNLSSSIEFLPAVVDTDMYHNPVSLPFVLRDINPGSTKEHFFESGAPAIGVLPFKRDEWKSIVYEFPKDNDPSRIRITTQLYNVYRKYFRTKKIFN